MRETPITFNTALLAKKKGFDFTSQFGYIVPIESEVEGLLMEIQGIVTVPIGSHIVYAPSQSVLQKWLREVHDIEVTMEVFKNRSSGRSIYVSIIYSDLIEEESDSGLRFSTYEEALEDGLYDALELIQ